jgi:tetratricopeptide (TPR) repeat protein
LFTEEVIHVLLERDLLVRRNGDVQWMAPPAVTFPDTIQDIMRARLDRLTEPVKRTVQTAAVVGREFSLRLLTRLAERAAEVPPHLEALMQAELIHETHVFPEMAYRFKHAVIQDVAYESLLAQRRQALHGAIGQAIEELYADRVAEQAAILAYHYARSVPQDKAIAYALLAGEQAARVYANAEATTYFEQALAIARALPPSPETQRAQIDASLKLVTVGGGQTIARDQQNLEQAHALAEVLPDEPRLAQVLYWRGRTCYVLGDPQTAIAYAQQSPAIADRLGDDDLAAPPVNLMGRAYWLQSNFTQVSQLLARSAEQMHRLENKSEEATAAGFVGIGFGFTGAFAQALTYAERGPHLAQEIAHPFAEAAAHQFRGNICERKTRASTSARPSRTGRARRPYSL